MVLVKRVPNNGTPSTRLLAMDVTTPVLISAAAAFVTSGVTRLVAPVWSSGPKGDGATSALQSAWAAAGACQARTDSPTSMANLALFMSAPPFAGLAPLGQQRVCHGLCRTLPELSRLPSRPE